MNFKRFHESKNLLFTTNVDDTNNGITCKSNADGSYTFSGTLTGSAANFPISASGRDFSYQSIASGTYTLTAVGGTVKCFLIFGGSRSTAGITYHESKNNDPYTFTCESGTIGYLLVRVVVSLDTPVTIYPMLNTGSQPQPYEPYSSEVWHNIPHYIHNTSTDTLATLPAVLYPNDTTATVGLKGQAVQSGTPTPTTPIQPSECGEITANILTAYKENYSINASGVETYNNVAMIYKAEVSVTGSTFTLDFGGLLTGDTVRIHAYTGDTWQEQVNAINIEQVPFSFTVGSNIDNIRISIRKTATDVTMTDGQYKIPILSNSTTTPVYLGEVQTTRRIKKMVLTGKESWDRQSPQHTTVINLYCPVTGAAPNSEIVSNIATYFSDAGVNNDSRVNVGKINSTGVNLLLDFSLSDFSTTGVFKTYLQQQYANGTPVCVWYVLATPETAVVNEPLRKIGDYADEVSGITIPTIAGANAVDVLTTLKPSEVSVNYKGWHTGAVHERDSGQWD